MSEETATPGQASATGKLLEIDHPVGGLRYMVHVFDLEDGGIAWVDSGWTAPLPSGHVCHYIEGKVAPCRDGWLLYPNEGGTIRMRLSERRAQPEGARSDAMQGIERSFASLRLVP